MEVGREKCTVFAIDLADQVLDFLLQGLVGLEIVSAQGRHLQKHRFTDESRVSFEESVKGMQFLRYSFYAIQAIDA